MPVTEKTYRRIALEDPEGHWELYDGDLRQKPGMTADHNDVMSLLFARLSQQLDRDQFRVRSNAGHVRRSAENYFIPDVYVVPAEDVRAQRGRRSLETFPSPLPLVVEIWSPSTGQYDVTTKLDEYRLRGDLEIWLIHPYDRTLTAWRRQPDGSYTDSHFSGGDVRPMALPGVAVDLDSLFD